MSIFIDFSKAFDTTDQNILLFQLEKGIGDYLSQRQQLLRIYKENSNNFYLPYHNVITPTEVKIRSITKCLTCFRNSDSLPGTVEGS